MGYPGSPQWSRLDNAAKIFPPTSTPRDTKVFRFTCELAEPVDPQILQHALDRTTALFPFYRSVLKKGFFWYYFEDSSLSPAVQPEDKPPCAPIYSADSRALLFRVLYNSERVSLEVFHALSDGTGALNFLKTLIYYYLLKRCPNDFAQVPPPFDCAASYKQADSFHKYFEKPPSSAPRKEQKAYRLRGERLPENRLGVVEGRMSVQALLSLAHKMGVTLTELMTAVLIRAIHQGMSVLDCARPVVITIPVNLRSYFPSESARNFFATINVGYDFKRQDEALESAAAYVKRCFDESLDAEKLRMRMNELGALEHSLPMRLIPLMLKNPVLRAANLLAEQKITAALSNIGRISMPAGMERHIRSFRVLTATNRLQACMCSFGDNFVISFTAPFRNLDIQREFFRQLTGLGIAAELTANYGQLEQ